MKQTLRYDQISCRLQVEGLPDVSAGQGSDAIGIVTGWSLQWAGRPELEGKKDHLQALMQAVLPYARLLISDAPRPQQSHDQAVQLAPAGPAAHRLTLRSSQPDTPPLTLQLDDAELADLVRVLDQARLDPRLALNWELPPPQPLRAREVLDRQPLAQRLIGPLGGAMAVAMVAALAWMLPAPRQLPAPVDAPAPASTLER
jgi:hypothetical protein